jgi:hypothetical protein
VLVTGTRCHDPSHPCSANTASGDWQQMTPSTSLACFTGQCHIATADRLHEAMVTCPAPLLRGTSREQTNHGHSELEMTLAHAFLLHLLCKCSLHCLLDLEPRLRSERSLEGAGSASIFTALRTLTSCIALFLAAPRCCGFHNFGWEDEWLDKVDETLLKLFAIVSKTFHPLYPAIYRCLE